MNNRCDDPMGFQGVDPNLFVIVGTILGDVMANELPFNVQNAVGNWLQLVGQLILTYNAQQQYFEQGPGRYFNPANFNVDNSNCQNNNNPNSTNKSTNEDNQKPDPTSDENNKDGSPSQATNTQKTQEETVRVESVNLMEIHEQMRLLLEKITSLEREVNALKTNLNEKEVKLD